MLPFADPGHDWTDHPVIKLISQVSNQQTNSARSSGGEGSPRSTGNIAQCPRSVLDFGPRFPGYAWVAPHRSGDSGLRHPCEPCHIETRHHCSSSSSRHHTGSGSHPVLPVRHRQHLIRCHRTRQVLTDITRSHARRCSFSPSKKSIFSGSKEKWTLSPRRGIFPFCPRATKG